MTSSDPKNESRTFTMQCWKTNFGSWFFAIAAIAGYLIALFDLSRAESLSLVACLAGWAIVASLVSEGGRRLQSAPILRFFDEGSTPDENGVESESASLAYHAIVSLPSQMRTARLVAGLVSIVVIPPMMWVLGFESWLTFERVRSFGIISLAVSLLGGMLCLYWAKQSLSSSRMAIAASVGDFEDGARPVMQFSLQKNLLIAVTVPMLASVLLLLDVVGESVRDEAEVRAGEWAMLVVDRLSASATDQPLSERVASQLPSKEFWPMPIEIVEITSDRVGASSTVDHLSRQFLDHLDRELQLGNASGMVLPDGGSEIGAFHGLGDGTALIATVMRSDFEAGWAGLNWVIGFVTFCMALVGVAFARLAGSEITRSAESLQAAAERIASGDLRPAGLCDTDGVLGSVGQEIDIVRQRLRATVMRMSSTVESVDQISAGISTVANDVVASNTDQVQQVQQASALMGTMGEQFGATSLIVVELTSAIDESTSSVTELGVTGDQLKETALVLSSKVDAVSGSIDQMIGSVKQVAGTSDRLASASEETSSSMEEMASSMRAVDTSAETTANLSRDVVRIAELGQAKVVQTIEGMEAIREATDVAESVIRGLGARTKEIGGILDVIDDVADETSLLALNAAIIAAQAGDQGKAFSVVADEIKELADRVLASTKEIGSLITAVQAESENAIGAIEAGSVSVMSGVDLSAEAGRTLEEITVASRESGSRISEIVASVREQTKAASHVASLMEKVRESAEEIGAEGNEQSRGNEIVYESAQTMRDVAQQVHRTTEDQALGFGRIRESVDGMREAVQQISGSLGEQSGACQQATEYLERVSERTRTNEEAAEKIRVATRELIAHSESLREESERFRV